MAEPGKSREWNAAEYHRLSAPQFRWGQRVLEGLSLRGDERLLDAGCGTGKLTRILLENLPKGHVVGLDVSRNMVAHARETLAHEFDGRISFVAADLLALPFHQCFDGIVSTASFHWVLDHDALFRQLHESLCLGGWLLAQCGGGPNLARLRERVRALSRTREYSRWLGEFQEPWCFSNAEDAAARLRASGFVDVEAGLEPAVFAVDSSQEFQDYLRTFILHRHLELLPDEALRASFVARLAEMAAGDSPAFTLDYWRLNMRGRKAQWRSEQTA